MKKVYPDSYRRGFVLPLAIGIIFLVLVLASAVFFVKYKTISKVTSSQTKQSISSINLQASAKSIDSLPVDAFVTIAPKVFTSSDTWFENQGFPKDMLSNKLNDLVEMQCTDFLQESYETPFVAYNPVTKTRYEIKDVKILNLIKEADISADPKINSIHYCNAKNSLKFLMVGQWGETTDGLIIYLIDDARKITSTIKSASNGAPYFGCSNPSQLTSNLVIYMRCAGGDGGLGKMSIFKVDVKNKTTKILTTCTSMSDGVHAPKIYCI